MAAPKGNTFSVGHGFGRPAKYDSAAEMQEVVIEYLESSKNSSGKYQPTIEGLTFHLGFATRKSLMDYAEKSEDFLNVINKAKQFIKACYEKQLYGFAWAGAQFALRNIGKEDWKDEITEHSNQTITKVEIIEKQREA
jgi:hypothetical protein